MGTGLAQAGPASRLVTLVTDRPVASEITDPVMKALTVKLKKENPDFYFSTSNFYIPESWYVQQLVEGGVIACFFLLAFLSIVLVRLSRYPYLFGAFLGVMIMNIFLHSFESVHTVLALFTLLSAILPVYTSRVSMSQVAKYLFAFFLFLLPWHALIVTFFQCKVHFDATLFRFWKEFFVGIFFVFTSGYILFRHTNIFTWYRKQPLLFWTVLFLIFSLLYIFFPG